MYIVCLSCMVLFSSLFGLYACFHPSCSRWAKQPYQVQLHPSPPSWGAGGVESHTLPNVSEEHSRPSGFCSVFLRLPAYLNINSTGKLYWKYSITYSSMDSGKKCVSKKNYRKNAEGQGK